MTTNDELQFGKIDALAELTAPSGELSMDGTTMCDGSIVGRREMRCRPAVRMVGHLLAAGQTFITLASDIR